MSISGGKQIDVDEVDPLLVNHLRNHIKACADAANVMQNQYNDLLEAIRARQSDVELSRRVGGLVADDDHQQSGREVAEFLYHMGTDDDFQTKLRAIIEKHQPEADAANNELEQVDQELKNVAKTLTEKYNVEFISSQ